MPYISKPKDLDGGAMGNIRVTGRDSFDGTALVESSTSATGGAPSVPSPEKQYQIQPIPGEATGPRLTDFGDIMPRIARNGRIDYTRIRPEDEGMIEELSSLAQSWAANPDSQAAKAVALAGGPREMAMRMAAIFQQNMEQIDSDVSLPARLYASQEARRLYRALEQMRRERNGG